MCEKVGAAGIEYENCVSEMTWASVRTGRPDITTPNMAVMGVKKSRLVGKLLRKYGDHRSGKKL